MLKTFRSRKKLNKYNHVQMREIYLCLSAKHKNLKEKPKSSHGMVEPVVWTIVSIKTTRNILEAY